VIRFHAAPGNDDLCRAAAHIHNLCFPRAWASRDIADLLARSGTALLDVVDPSDLKTMHGFLLYRQVAGEAEILTLCVAPSHRRAGFARQLVNALKACLLSNDVKALFLEVEETNRPALRLYETCGFTKIGMRKDYYGKGAHALVMQLAESIEGAV
jgi:ribosomal-protein-alanine N-acetyltransferase